MPTLNKHGFSYGFRMIQISWTRRWEEEGSFFCLSTPRFTSSPVYLHSSFPSLHASIHCARARARTHLGICTHTPFIHTCTRMGTLFFYLLFLHTFLHALSNCLYLTHVCLHTISTHFYLFSHASSSPVFTARTPLSVLIPAHTHASVFHTFGRNRMDFVALCATYPSTNKLPAVVIHRISPILFVPPAIHSAFGRHPFFLFPLCPTLSNPSSVVGS